MKTPPDFVADDVEHAPTRRLSPSLPLRTPPLVFGSRPFSPCPKQKKKLPDRDICLSTASYSLYARQAQRSLDLKHGRAMSYNSLHFNGLPPIHFLLRSPFNPPSSLLFHTPTCLLHSGTVLFATGFGLFWNTAVRDSS